MVGGEGALCLTGPAELDTLSFFLETSGESPPADLKGV